MNEITVQELQAKLNAKDDFQFIDVRENHEYELGNIGAQHIPMGTIMDSIEIFDKNKLTIVMCRSGARSGATCNALSAAGFENIYNLKGGIMAWAKEIDNSIQF